MAKLSAGKEALAYCTSCRMDLAHTIIALQGDRIIKVECKTCKKPHAYRNPKGVTDPEKAPKATKESKSAATSRIPIEEEWQKLRHLKKDTPMKLYNFKNTYDVGDKISHPQYGEGFISKVMFPNKVQVLFADDLRILIHAKG